MEHMKGGIRERLAHLWLQCRLYRRGLIAVGIITTAVLISGVLRDGASEDSTLSIPENMHRQSVHEYHSTVTMLYDISPALRPYPWREVVRGNPDLLTGDEANEGERDEQMESASGKKRRKRSTDNKKDTLTAGERGNGRNVDKAEAMESGRNKAPAEHRDSDNPNHHTIGKILIKGVIMGPVPQFIVERQGKTKVMTPGDAWGDLRMTGADENCVEFQEGGVKTCVLLP